MRAAPLVLLLLLMWSCRPETYTPRQRGYARIDTQQHVYQRFDRPGFPYAFDYPVYGTVNDYTVVAGMKPDNPYWINIDFPTLGGTIYLSYKVIDAGHSLKQLLDDSHEISTQITRRADYMNTPAFHNEHGVHGILYNVGGNAASSYQFFATDSTTHFLRGALYFNTTPNADSLKPVTDFLRTDIEYLLGSLQWK